MHGSRKFCQRGSNSDFFVFFFVRGERIQIALKAGHHQPASETPIDSGPTLSAGLVAL